MGLAMSLVGQGASQVAKFVTLAATIVVLSCSGTTTQCTGCLDSPPRICNSSCATRLPQGDGGGGPPFECACTANECGNDSVAYALICDDSFCQCTASGIVGNAGGQFPAPMGVCDSDVSVIEGLFDSSCNFPPK
jgi:hypothetical protein